MNITEETIDSFLRGDLSSAEVTAFNEGLAADPKLQQEVSFQRDIIDSVKQNRHQQLKNRLDSIDIKPVGIGFYSSPYFKLAASIGVVAFIVGTFSFFNTTEDNNADIVESNETGIEYTEKSSVKQPLIASEENTNSNSKVENTTSAPAVEHIDSKATTVSKTNSKPQKGTPNTTYEDLSEEPMDSENTIEGINENFDMPTADHGGNTSNISSPQIKVSIVKENNLGYRFFNNQLFLHGNFSNSTYELFELNNKPSKQLFLYFEKNYYELIQGKTKITSLTPITDKAILIQLNQLREH